MIREVIFGDLNANSAILVTVFEIVRVSTLVAIVLP